MSSIMTNVEITSTYCGYTIKPKKDWGPYGGFLIDGEVVKEGWVVTDGGIINVMPGATWFRTMKEAHKGIAALELAKALAATGQVKPPLNTNPEAHAFWMLMELTR